MNPTPAQRYARLLEEVRRHDRLYYVEARPEISDAAYDRLYRELQDFEKAHPDLADDNSPTKKVGGTPLDSFRTVRHTVPMQSLNNTYSEKELGELRRHLKSRYAWLTRGGRETIGMTPKAACHCMPFERVVVDTVGPGTLSVRLPPWRLPTDYRLRRPLSLGSWPARRR